MSKPSLPVVHKSGWAVKEGKVRERARATICHTVSAGMPETCLSTHKNRQLKIGFWGTRFVCMGLGG